MEPFSEPHIESLPEPDEEPFYKNRWVVFAAIAFGILLIGGGILFASSGGDGAVTDATDQGDSESQDDGDEEAMEDEEDSGSSQLSAVAADSGPREIPTTTTTRPPGELPLPDVVGVEFNDALLELFDFDVRIEREDEPSDDVAEGVIISTDPEAGEMVSEEAVVLVIVSSGPESSEPDS